MDKIIELNSEGIVIAEDTTVQLKAEEPLLIKDDRYEYFDSLLCTVSRSLKTCYLTNGRFGFYYRGTHPLYRVLQSRVTYELAEGYAGCINKLKQLAEREAGELTVVFMDNLSNLLDDYPALVSLLLRRIRDRNCFIIALEPVSKISIFHTEFFRQIISVAGEETAYNGKQVILYKGTGYSVDRADISILQEIVEEYADELSINDWQCLFNESITPDLDKETFTSILKRLEGDHNSDDNLLKVVIQRGKAWMLEELLEAGHRYKHDTEVNIMFALDNLSAPPDFKEKLDVLKKYYPEWFSSSVYGFQLLAEFLSNAFHNNHLVSDSNYGTPEYWHAMSEVRKDMFLYLLSLVPFISVFGSDENRRYTLLHIAADYCEDMETLLDAVLELGLDPNVYSDDHSTPLHLACSSENPYMTRALLAAGANPDLEDKDGNVPLHLASCQCTRILLESGADDSRFNDEGETPLMKAISTCSEEDDFKRISLLADTYDETLTDSMGRNAMMLISDAGVIDEEIYTKMLSRTKDLNRRDRQGRTLLYHLVSNAPYREMNFIDQVLKAGASPYIRDCNGDTPLCALTFKTILDKGAYRDIISTFPKDVINLQDFRGRSVLHDAVEHGEIQLIEALMEAGANPALTDAMNTSPIDLCNRVRTGKAKGLILKLLTKQE